MNLQLKDLDLLTIEDGNILYRYNDSEEIHELLLDRDDYESFIIELYDWQHFVDRDEDGDTFKVYPQLEGYTAQQDDLILYINETY